MVGVVAAAEAGLDGGDVDAGGGKLGERGRRQHLELRGFEPLRRRPDPAERALEVRLRSPDADPLGPAVT